MKEKCKSILIIGVNGQDGSYLAESFLKYNDIKVIGLGRQPSYKYRKKDKNFEYISIDISKLNALHDVLRTTEPNMVFHAAAIHGSAGFCYENFWYEANIINTLSINLLLEYIRLENSSCKLFFLSSIKVFDEIPSFSINENSPRSGKCIYSTTKLAAENLIAYYRTVHEIQGYTIWTGNHDSERRSNDYFIPKIANSIINALNSSNARFNTNVSHLDFYCDWGDAREYMEFLARNYDRINRDFILATGRSIHARELVSKAFKKYGLNYLDYIIEANQINNIKMASIDVSNSQNLFGQIPTNGPQDVIDRIVGIR